MVRFRGERLMDDRRDLLTPEERQKLKQNSMIKGYERKKTEESRRKQERQEIRVDR